MAVVHGAENAPDLSAIIHFSQSSPDWFGPPVINIGINYFFLGVFCCQLWNYYDRFPKDSTWIKRLVGLAFCLCIFRAIQTSVLVWKTCVIGFGDRLGALRSGWLAYLEPMVVILIATSAQSFFGWRCFVLTGRNRYILWLLVLAILAAEGLCICLTFVLAIDPSNSRRVRQFMLPLIGLGMCIDAVITFIISYKLIVSRNRFNPSTNAIITKLLIITLESALPPTLSNVANIVITLKAERTPMWINTGTTITAWLYVFSLMYTLNSRADTRNSLATHTNEPWRGGNATVELSDVRFKRPGQTVGTPSTSRPGEFLANRSGSPGSLGSDTSPKPRLTFPHQLISTNQREHTTQGGTYQRSEQDNGVN